MVVLKKLFITVIFIKIIYNKIKKIIYIIKNINQLCIIKFK